MGKVKYYDQNLPNDELEFSDKYSFKNFAQRTLLNVGDLEGAVIYASDFHQEEPDTKVFPESLHNISFYNCNLMNVKINKPGWKTFNCQEQRYKVQNDKNDWLIDEQNKPTMPIDHKIFTKFGLPMPLPEDIPAQIVDEPVDLIEIAKHK